MTAYTRFYFKSQLLFRSSSFVYNGNGNGAVKQAFLRKGAQSLLKPVPIVVVKVWERLRSMCREPQSCKGGHRLYRRPSYTAGVTRVVVRCTEYVNRKAAALFGVDESNVRLWWKHKAAISECEASRKIFTGPKNRQIPATDDVVFWFLTRHTRQEYNVLYCILLMTRTTAPSFSTTQRSAANLNRTRF
jgi:hypothetical protein